MSNIPHTFTHGYEHNLGDFSAHTADMKPIAMTMEEAQVWAQEIHAQTVEHYDGVISEAMEELTFPRYRYNMTLLNEQEYEAEVREQMEEELTAEMGILAQYLHDWSNAAPDGDDVEAEVSGIPADMNETAYEKALLDYEAAMERKDYRNARLSAQDGLDACETLSEIELWQSRMDAAWQLESAGDEYDTIWE